MTNEKQYEDMEPREKFEALWLKQDFTNGPVQIHCSTT